MNSKEIGMTIVDQLGGNHALMMIGAHHVVCLARTPDRIGGVSIPFKAQALRAIKSVKIELMNNDTYNVQFFGRAPGHARKAGFEQVYCDELQSLFEEITGLRTNLFGRQVQFG